MKCIVGQTESCVGKRAHVGHADRRIRAEGVAAKFGENLLRCRRRAGFSQEELGVRASLHRTEIGLLENGRRIARVDTVIQLAGAMSIDPAELLEGIHWNAGDVASGRFAISQRPPVPPRRGRTD